MPDFKPDLPQPWCQESGYCMRRCGLFVELAVDANRVDKVHVKLKLAKLQSTQRTAFFWSLLLSINTPTPTAYPKLGLKDGLKFLNPDPLASTIVPPRPQPTHDRRQHLKQLWPPHTLTSTMAKITKAKIVDIDFRHMHQILGRIPEAFTAVPNEPGTDTPGQL
ncbi:MAG: hypothetical protein ALECFALPRED_002531 [Alectoria fallacina]|uniref:Uncharacterized protein n=1 Tax=Alectoria fallacina TaxID=1903189 RepID=A0A8H3FMJ0_9LECA|nr:MAG: hypothetical protein ALECFALPRED_002531 [Alectoria fallacina]